MQTQCSLRPGRMELFQNAGSVSAAQIKAQKGCDHVLSGGYFELSSSRRIYIHGRLTYRPCGVLRQDGEEIVHEWNAEGIGFDPDGSFQFGWSNEVKTQNFVYGDILISGAVPRVPRVVAPGALRAAARMVLGETANGQLWYMGDSAALSLDAVVQRGLAAGLKTMLLLDGSDTAQWANKDGAHKTGRSWVPYWICIWEEENNMDKARDDGGVSLPTLQKGSKGVSVKILQTALKLRGYACGAADGAFGAKTEAAVMRLQAAHGLPADGIGNAAVWSVLLQEP